LYDAKIRHQVESQHLDDYVVIDVLTGEYEVDSDDLRVSKRAKARFGDDPLFTVRVGHEAAYRLGAGAYAPSL
jgi:hypothetical protein